MDILKEFKEKLPDFDINRAQHIVFTSPEESTTDNVNIVLYDDASCSEAFSGNEILSFVKAEKIQGIIVPSNKVKDLIILLLTAYPVLMQLESKLEDRLKIANRISSLLSEVKAL